MRWILPTGIPLAYELDDDLRAICHHYLGDEEEIKKATESVAGQITQGKNQTNDLKWVDKLNGKHI